MSNFPFKFLILCAFLTPNSLLPIRAPVVQRIRIKTFAFIVNLVNLEERLVPLIQSFGASTPHRYEIVENYLKDYENSKQMFNRYHKREFHEFNDLSERASLYVSNPLLLYRMTRRVAFYLLVMLGRARADMDSKSVLMDAIDQAKDKDQLPSYLDYQELMNGILNMQYDYDIKAEDISNGNILGLPTGVKLTKDECLEIVEHAIALDYYYLAKEWIIAAAQRAGEETGEHIDFRSLTGGTIKTIPWMDLVSKHDNNYLRNRARQHRLIFSKKLSVYPDAPPLKEEMMQRYDGGLEDSGPHAEHYRELRLCKGKDMRDPLLTSVLKCRFSKKHPYFILVPLKFEEISNSPEILMLHDVIPHKWMEMMKHVSNIKREKWDYDSAYGWLSDKELENYNAPISKKLELALGLKLRDGASGNWRLGVDTLVPDQVPNEPEKIRIDSKKHRFSTIALSLSDAERGGRLVFSKIGVTVENPKGSILYWKNLRKNGNIDRRTEQTSCGIAMGTKWTAAKAVFEEPNIFNELCDLDPLL